MSKFRTLKLIALAMLSIAWAQSAQAGTCGDYLQMSHEQPSFGTVDNPLGPVKHCHGPRCSESNPNPAPFDAPSPVQLRPDRQLLVLVKQEQVEQATARSFPPMMLDQYGLELPSGIFHPPRMA